MWAEAILKSALGPNIFSPTPPLPRPHLGSAMGAEAVLKAALGPKSTPSSPLTCSPSPPPSPTKCICPHHSFPQSGPLWAEEILKAALGPKVKVHNGAMPGTPSSYMSGGEDVRWGGRLNLWGADGAATAVRLGALGQGWVHNGALPGTSAPTCQVGGTD